MALSTKKIRIIAGVLVVLAGVGLYLFLHRHEEHTDDAQIDTTVVSISPKIGGYVQAMHVDDNQLVKAGDPLVEIDPTDYQLRHDRSDAARQSAAALVTVAEANQAKSQQDLTRVQALGKLAGSKQELDVATTATKTTEASVADAQARLKLAEADFAQTEKDLQDTKLAAPMDGRIAQKGVERGDYVQPGQQLLSLVSRDLWIVANFKETQLKHMKIGQPVDVTIDAFPDVELHGKIDSFQSGTGSRFSAFPAENATGNFVKIVQRVPVKIVFDTHPDQNLPIGPGMSADVTVHTDR